MNRYLHFLKEFTPILKQINMATIVIAKRTLPRHALKKSGQPYAQQGFLQIEGAPYMVTSIKNCLFTLNGLPSSEKKIL